LPDVDSFQGRREFCYGAYALRRRLSDSEKVNCETSGIFYAFDTKGPTVILGRPWRAQQAIVVDSLADRWYCGEAPPEVRVEGPEQFLNSIAASPRVFLVIYMGEADEELAGRLGFATVASNSARVY
jgi:hypothetical protein